MCPQFEFFSLVHHKISGRVAVFVSLHRMQSSVVMTTCRAVWLPVPPEYGFVCSRQRDAVSLLLLSFLTARERKSPSVQSLAFVLDIRSVMWRSVTSPLMVWRSWPTVNIPWQPWSPAPCSHHWWSFRLRASCWARQPACPFQIWVCTQAHDITCRLIFDLQCSVQQNISILFQVVSMKNEDTVWLWSCHDWFMSVCVFHVTNHHLTTHPIITQCGDTSINAVRKVQVIYFCTITKNIKKNSKGREAGEAGD